MVMMMRWTTKISAPLLSLALLGGLAQAAHAQDKAPEERINAYEELARANKLAGAGALSRSIPHYERALRGDPTNYAIAHYNLGEVQRARGKCEIAGFHYQAYAAIGTDAETVKAAREGAAACGKNSWPVLSVIAQPKAARVTINGFVFSEGAPIEGLALPSGDYTLAITLTDHEPHTRELTLRAGQQERVSVSLKKMAFFGTAAFEVSEPGATVVITPRQLDNPEARGEPLTLTSPITEKTRLPTGSYFVEVTREGYERWIRNIQVSRDADTQVQVRLSRALPDEISKPSKAAPKR